jgi:hypothetical protein
LNLISVAREDSVVLQNFTNEQLNIIKQGQIFKQSLALPMLLGSIILAFQQDRFPNKQTTIRLANQFNTDIENVSVRISFIH